MLVLCYHAVSPDWPSVLAVTPAQLRSQVQYLLSRGYRPLTFAQLTRAEPGGKLLAVTFDDGYRSVLEHGFPVLSELGVPASIFVPTNYVGRPEPMSWPGIDQWSPGPHQDELLPLDWDQLRQLRDAGWEVGSHTRSHPRLPEFDDASLAAELVGSREDCEREMGEPCLTLAYPYGDDDPRVRAAAREAGYSAAAVLRPGAIERYAWPRIGLYPGDRSARFRVKSSIVVNRVRASAPGRAIERLR
jgi:peptidoglycan/xylan/chitin deacetylase (PgdA/CDA1 family)